MAPGSRWASGWMLSCSGGGRRAAGHDVSSLMAHAGEAARGEAQAMQRTSGYGGRKRWRRQQLTPAGSPVSSL
eukprot:13387453-Alexandrium_andersonii.AAC.1